MNRLDVAVQVVRLEQRVEGVSPDLCDQSPGAGQLLDPAKVHCVHLSAPLGREGQLTLSRRSGLAGLLLGDLVQLPIVPADPRQAVPLRGQPLVNLPLSERLVTQVALRRQAAAAGIARREPDVVVAARRVGRLLGFRLTLEQGDESPADDVHSLRLVGIVEHAGERLLGDDVRHVRLLHWLTVKRVSSLHCQTSSGQPSSVYVQLSAS